jgi:hypothetical protein
MWDMIASIAGPLVGGLMGSNEAESGGQTQLQAGREANELQKYMYDTTRADNAPFLNNGVAANNKLAYFMGLGGNTSSGSSSTNMLAAPQDRAKLRAQLEGQYTKYLDNGNELTPEQWQYRGGVPYAHYGSDPSNSSQIYFPELQKQIDEAGLSAALDARMGQGGQSTQGQFSNSSTDPNFGFLLRRFQESDLQDDVPYKLGMQFALDEGRKGIERMAAANGGADNGAIQKALVRFGADTGNKYGGDAYNRFTNDQGNIYNKLAGMSGTGQTAVSQVGAAGQNYANTAGENLMAMGTARGASGIAGARAMSGGLSGAYNNYQQNKLLGGLTGGGLGGGGFSGMGGFGGGFDHSMFDPTYGAGGGFYPSGGFD